MKIILTSTTGSYLYLLTRFLCLLRIKLVPRNSDAFFIVLAQTTARGIPVRAFKNPLQSSAHRWELLTEMLITHKETV